jgi:hypothetical protein
MYALTFLHLECDFPLHRTQVLISSFTFQQTQHQHRLALDMLLALFYNDILRCSVPQCPPPAEMPALQAPASTSDTTVISSAHEAEFYVRDALAQWQRLQRPSLAESPTDLEGEFAPAQSARWAGILLYAFVHTCLARDTDFSQIWRDHGKHLQDKIKATITSSSHAGKSPEA